MARIDTDATPVLMAQIVRAPILTAWIVSAPVLTAWIVCAPILVAGIVSIVRIVLAPIHGALIVNSPNTLKIQSWFQGSATAERKGMSEVTEKKKKHWSRFPSLSTNVPINLKLHYHLNLANYFPPVNGHNIFHMRLFVQICSVCPFFHIFLASFLYICVYWQALLGTLLKGKTFIALIKIASAKGGRCRLICIGSVNLQLCLIISGTCFVRVDAFETDKIIYMKGWEKIIPLI